MLVLSDKNLVRRIIKTDEKLDKEKNRAGENLGLTFT